MSQLKRPPTVCLHYVISLFPLCPLLVSSSVHLTCCTPAPPFVRCTCSKMQRRKWYVTCSEQRTATSQVAHCTAITDGAGSASRCARQTHTATLQPTKEPFDAFSEHAKHAVMKGEVLLSAIYCCCLNLTTQGYRTASAQRLLQDIVNPPH